MARKLGKLDLFHADKETKQERTNERIREDSSGRWHKSTESTAPRTSSTGTITAMKYVSTRDNNLAVSFEDALTSGYASDGGLWVPQNLPQNLDLPALSKLGYVDLAFTLLRMFVAEEEVPTPALQKICAQAFEGFVDPANAVPVVKVGPLYVAELFHGPTFCFKDLG